MSLEPIIATPSQPNRRSAFALPLRLFFVVALLLSTFGGAFGALTPGASAATTTLTVNSTVDAITPGACTAALANACTLREAIIEANALALITPADTYVINLDSTATYVLTLTGRAEDASATGDLDIKANVTLNGKGIGTGPGAIIQGNDPSVENPDITQEDRVFQVFGGYTVTFNDLIIEDGYAYQEKGGGILHDGGNTAGGALTLNNVTVTDNDTGVVQNASGAAIYNGVDRTLTLNTSTVSDNGSNTPINPGDGGGIYNDGTATLTNSTVTGNYAGSGGGIYNTSMLTVTGGTISNNSANTSDGSTGNGGGIYNTGTLTATGGVITKNIANGVNSNGGNGGGIYNIGTTNIGTPTLAGSTVTANTTSVTTQNGTNNGSANNGGGIYNVSVLTLVNNSAVTSNASGVGGGIYNIGELTLMSSAISNNTSFSTSNNNGPLGIFGVGGGGLFNGGSAELTNSTVAGNSAVNGGGIANSIAAIPERAGAAAQFVPGTLTLTNTAVTANTALFFGGGIFNFQGNLSATGGTLTSNTASGFPFLGFGGQGGALLNFDTATLTNTTLSNNSASNFSTGSLVPIGPFNASTGNGGAIGNAGTLNISGTTFSGNSVAGPGAGGALYNGPLFFNLLATKAGLKPGARAASVDTVATITNSTFGGNITTNGGAAILNDDNSTVNLTNVTIASNQSGIQNRTGQTNPDGVINVQNSIVANNTDYNCSGTITNGGYNIDSAATCAFGTTGGSLSGTDPQLSPLALNAPGTTQTFALAATSPAIDKGSNAICAAAPVNNVDQRGVARPQGAACDIGAYEFVPPVASPSPSPSTSPSPSPSPTPVGTFTVALSTTGSGSVNPAAGTYTYQSGSTQAFTATPASGQVFLGWTVDNTFVGFGNPLNLPVTKNRTVVAAFAPIPAFCDVTTATANYTAITQLAARGVIFGSDSPSGTGKCFNGGEYLARIHVAGFVARLFGWANEDHGNTFTDKGFVDDTLWRNAGTLAFYDVARGYRDGTYDPTGNVLHAQAVSFVTRAMIRKGYWEYQGDNGAYYSAVPTASGHRQDAVTFYTYAGNIPGTVAPTDSWGRPDGYDGQSSRNYFVNVLWQAYSSYFSTNHIP